jgi:hypothetical protein
MPRRGGPSGWVKGWLSGSERRTLTAVNTDCALEGEGVHVGGKT